MDTWVSEIVYVQSTVTYPVHSGEPESSYALAPTGRQAGTAGKFAPDPSDTSASSG